MCGAFVVDVFKGSHKKSLLFDGCVLFFDLHVSKKKCLPLFGWVFLFFIFDMLRYVFMICWALSLFPGVVDLLFW